VSDTGVKYTCRLSRARPSLPSVANTDTQLTLPDTQTHTQLSLASLRGRLIEYQLRLG